MNFSRNCFESIGINLIVGKEIGMPPSCFTNRINSVLLDLFRVIAMVLLIKVFPNKIIKVACHKSIRITVLGY